MSQHTIISGYKILNLALIESHFTRSSNITFDIDRVARKSDTSVDINQVTDERVMVTETLTYEQSSDENGTEFSATIKMIGFFEKVGDTELGIDTFAKINAPAIIYPYIREHLSSLTTKAAVGTVILAPYNFQAVEDNVSN